MASTTQRFSKLGATLLWLLMVLLLLSLVSSAYARVGYRQFNLVSDIRGLARNTDPNLVNPWGIEFGPTGLLWVADNGTGVSTVYRPSSGRRVLTVTIPAPPSSSTGVSAPTGIVFNSTMDFVVSANGLSSSSIFLFATEDGTIAGWDSSVDPANAITAVDNSASGAVYKGITIANSTAGNVILATNFAMYRIDVFDADFQPVMLPSGAFTDPNLPAGFAPFGIRNIGGDIIVTYAKVGPGGDDEPGPGNGFVDIYDADGNLITRFASGGTLNSPWGIALVPRRFGRFSNALLIGNFGDGTINVFNPATGEFLGQLTNRNNNVIAIEGLWGLSFFSRSSRRGERGNRNDLYFAAGINDEANGLLGFLRPNSPGTRPIIIIR